MPKVDPAVVTFNADASICAWMAATAWLMVTLLKSVIPFEFAAKVMVTGVVAVEEIRELEMLKMLAPAALKSK